MYQRFRLSVAGMNKDIKSIVISIYSLSTDVNFSNFEAYFRYALPLNVVAIFLYLATGVYLAYRHQTYLNHLLSVYTMARPHEVAARVHTLHLYHSLMLHSSLNEAALVGCYLSRTLRDSQQQSNDEQSTVGQSDSVKAEVG